MIHRTTDPDVTSPIPRDELVALLGRARRGDAHPDAAKASGEATSDRAAIVVHHAGIDAWLAARR